ncbi:MAG: hypothetical protein ABIC36_01555 [bacterium]
MGSKSKFKFLTYQNYLEMIKASENSEMFRHVYILDNGQKKDILKNGQLSCAYYVSCILKLFDLISETHATVEGTIEDMVKNSWQPTKKLIPGNILVWEEKDGHQHIGFYLGSNKAISNFSKKGVPVIHEYTYDKKRKVIQTLTHKII